MNVIWGKIAPGRTAKFGLLMLLLSARVTALAADAENSADRKTGGAQSATSSTAALATLPKPTPEQAKFFESKVRPLLVARCIKCHGPEEQNGELRLDSPHAIARGGESGQVVVPGDPSKSELIDAINWGSREMPPKKKLAKEEIAILTDWVTMGAPWPLTDLVKHDSGPSKEKITAEDRAYWAFQKVTKPAPPVVPDDKWSRNAIDQFVLQRLVSEGLRPAVEADRATLIRRAYFDLIGLPPTYDEVAAFVADNASDAYEQMIERLLADPRYGERWGRHWLDLVRYAESDGYRQDAFRENAWRYRDYVIRSINADTPYDKFVALQLAGDEIAPTDVDARIATGFLRHGIYEYNQRDVRTQASEILNEVTDVTSDVFLGLGMGCARCHDHKFDPLLQKDYFRLQAYFAPMVWRDDIPAPTAEQRAEYEKKHKAWEAATESIRAEIAEAEAGLQPPTDLGSLKKFPEDIQEILRKPAAERTPGEAVLAAISSRQLVKLSRPGLKNEQKAVLDALYKRLAAHDALKPEPLPVAIGVEDIGVESPPTIIPGRKSDSLLPGIPEVLGGQTAVFKQPKGLNSTGRRTALAQWIASADHPLTARVMVNRIWQFHFGRGLVATSSDFGRLGEKPTHPELLDWLASEFVSQGWSIKQMHRLMMNSATYRQASLGVATKSALLKDPENLLLWKANCRRLDADQVRDAVLAVTGEIEHEMYGPSVPSTRPRRSIYTKAIRNTRDSLLEVFDSPDGYLSTAQRNATTTATQALLMINGDWMLARADALAGRLQKLSGDDDAKAITAAYSMVYGRLPNTHEQSTAALFLAAQAERMGKKKVVSEVGRVAQRMPQREGNAAIFEPGTENVALTMAEKGALPTADFTIEAFVMLESVLPRSNVRTIAAHWTNNKAETGWSLGVTGESSKFKPQNVVLQVWSGAGGKTSDYVALPANIFLQMNKPYYLAAVFKTADENDRSVTFYVKDLSDNDAPLLTSKAAHKVALPYRSEGSFTIGGLDRNASGWDGLIDDVRLTATALSRERLLYESNEMAEQCVGYWRFEETPGFFGDSSRNKLDLAQQQLKAADGGAKQSDSTRRTVLVDFSHVLLNSSEVLYVD